MSHCTLREGKVNSSPLLPPTSRSQGLNRCSLQSRIFLVELEPSSPFGLALRALRKPDLLVPFGAEPRQWDLVGRAGVCCCGPCFPRATGLLPCSISEPPSSASLPGRLSSARPGVRGLLSAATQGSRIWRTGCPSSHLGSQQKARGHKADLNLYGTKCFRGWVPLPAVLCSLDLWPVFDEGF